MKYFCIGHFKTGTSSYSRAMNQLGLIDLHFPPNYTTQLTKEGVLPWDLRPWDSMSNLHEVEYPQCDDLYPDSKFILTTRNIDKWLQSIHNHMKRSWPKDLQTVFNSRFQKIYGVPCVGAAFDEAIFRKVFEQHDKGVREYFAGTDQLVVLDLDGEEDLMKKLSNFVGKDTRYPHLNKLQKVRTPGEAFLMPMTYSKAV